MSPSLLGPMLLYQNGIRFRSLSQLYRASLLNGNVDKVLLTAGVPEVPNLVRHFAKLVSFPLAQTGEGISECELVAWSIKPGDVVSPFDKLCDVQSDKAAIEITSRYSGKVLALHHAVGAMVKVGAPLVDIEVADDVHVAPEHLAVPSSPPPPPPPPGPGTTTDLADASGSSESVAAPSVPVTTAAAAAAAGEVTMEVAAAAAAVPLPPPPSPSPPPPSQPPPPSRYWPAGRAKVQASPAVRAFAKASGVDISLLVGTGPGGRITHADVAQYLAGGGAAGLVGGSPHRLPSLAEGEEEEYGSGGGAGGGSVLHSSDFLAGPPPPPSAVAAAAGPRSVEELLVQYTRLTAATAPPPPRGGGGGGGGAANAMAESTSGVVPLRGYRRAMVTSMTAAAAVPVFHLHDEVVMDRLVAARDAMKTDPAAAAAAVMGGRAADTSGGGGGHGDRKAGSVRLTVLPLIIKALSAALKLHPQINASLSPGGTELLVHPYHNIGVAMATPSGLVVPNIKHVERKSVAQLASELQLLQQLAAAGRLPAEALAGGTITISNIGTIGGKYGTPLVTPPTVAIVALGRLQLLPRYPPGTTMSTAATAASPFTYQSLAAAGAAGSSSLPLPHPLPVPVSIMPVSWGADHRAIDGAALAAFSNSWKALLEHPERLLLHLT